MSVLDRKLLRDLARMWAQVLAISLVMACGVATIVLAVGAYRSLEETRAAFYDQYRFASVFAGLTRAPTQIREQIAAIPGVSSAELRIVKPVLLDLPGMVEPAAGIAVSIPDRSDPAVNRLYLRTGRLPEPGRTGEIAVLESFAAAHRMSPGSTFEAVMNGRKRRALHHPNRGPFCPKRRGADSAVIDNLDARLDPQCASPYLDTFVSGDKAVQRMKVIDVHLKLPAMREHGLRDRYPKGQIYLDLMPIFVSAVCKVFKAMKAAGIPSKGFDAETYAVSFTSEIKVDLGRPVFKQLRLGGFVLSTSDWRPWDRLLTVQFWPTN